MNVARSSSPWVAYHVPDKAYNGYTLFTPKGGSVAWLIDMEGRFVHYWEMPRRVGEYGVLLPSGNLLYGGQVTPKPDKYNGIGGVLLEVDWDGNIVWKYKASVAMSPVITGAEWAGFLKLPLIKKWSGNS